MTDKTVPSRAIDSPTGEMPKSSLVLPPRAEPPIPRSLPEFPELDSATGHFTRPVSEGEDKARNADDKAAPVEHWEAPTTPTRK